MTRAPDIHLLLQGSDKKRFQDLGVEVSEHLSEDAAEEILNLFVLVSPLHLRGVAPVVKAANKKKHLRGLLVEPGRDPHWVTAMMDRAELRTLRNTLVHSDPAVFERVLKAWKMVAQDQLIADATILEDLLFVRTCALETVEVELQELKPLRKASREALLYFEVDQDGAALYWPELDVHLDLEAIQVARDPSLRQKYQRARLVDDQLMGKAIKAIREHAGLRQSDIEGVSPRQVRRIENGEVRARSTTLKSFAEAHGLSFNDYLNRLSEKMGVVRG